MINHVNSPTRVTSNSQRVIDLLLSTSSLEGPCEVLPVDISDHYALLARLAVGVDKVQRKPRASRSLYKVDWPAFNTDLSRSLQSFTMSDNIDESVDSWYCRLRDVLDVHAPLQMRRKRARRPCPWLTDALVDLVQRRNSLRKRLAKEPGNDTIRREHKNVRRETRRLDRRLRNEYFVRKCDTTDSHKLWSVIDTVTGRVKTRCEPKLSLNALCETFGDIVTDHHRPQVLLHPFGPPAKSHLSDFQPCTASKVLKLLKEIDISKATGSDNIPGLVLKMAAETLAPSLCDIFNQSIRTGQVPAAFKSSYVCPLFKAGDPTIPTNYRPVSLLPIVSILLEKLVKEQVIQFLDVNSLLPPTQFAYRSRHSTEDALILAVDRWQTSKYQRKTTGIVMVDMSKAFDRVRHSLLISELHALGLHGQVLNWFASYLSGRSQKVKCGTQLSAERSCSRGVPQGSVLGPLLFVLYTRGIHDILPPGLSHQEFADDIIIDVADSDPEQVAKMLTDGVSRLANWLDSIGLLLNKKNTQVMFVKPRGLLDVPFSVQCNGETLETISSAKYLGLEIDDDLSWASHLQHVSVARGI